MLRWLERFAALLIVLVAIGVLLACWAPAYVGASDAPKTRHQRNFR